MIEAVVLKNLCLRSSRADLAGLHQGVVFVVADHFLDEQ